MVLFPLTFDVPHGAFELAGMLVTMVTLTYLITRRWSVALGIPVIGCELQQPGQSPPRPLLPHGSLTPRCASHRRFRLGWALLL